jgi:catechol 2,3-dioxygenase-like lactoylglutathione lyase family enzyme
LRGPGARPTIERRIDQSALARPAAPPDREHVLERVRAALRAVANPHWADHRLTFEDPHGFPIVLVSEPWACQ